MTVDKDAVGYAPDHPAVLASLEAMALGVKGWKARRDECYAWLRVKQTIDLNAASNVGRRNVHWSRRASGSSGYQISLIGPWDRRLGYAWIKAPDTLEKARVSPLLEKAVAKRDAMLEALVAEFGPNRAVAHGLSAKIAVVLNATEEGRAYLSARGQSTLEYIARLALAAEQYPLDKWSPASSRAVHLILKNHPRRFQLVASGLGEAEAQHEMALWVNGKAEETGKRIGRPRKDPFRPLTPVRAHARGKVSLPEDLKLELGLAYETGITLDDIVAFWTSLDGSEVAEAVAV